MLGGSSTERRLIAFLASACLALLLACGYLGWRVTRPAVHVENAQVLLDNGPLREMVVQELVSQSRGIFDSHPDPDVGRVLQPNLRGVEHRGVPVFSNAWGLREDYYALPKPDGVLRVVILGDSFVYGSGIVAEHRLGVFLEDYLRGRAPGFEGEIECLHIGVGSWNVVAETEFVRRQLGELRPDLVAQMIVSNDLDDTQGVRGFGAMSDLSPRYRWRADSRVHMTFPVRHTRAGNINYLFRPIGWESVQRYDEMGVYTKRLADAVERGGGRYLLVVHWASQKNLIRPFIDGRLRDDQILYLPSVLRTARELWNSASDRHWNRRGNEQAAQLLFGVIRLRSLLPGLELEPWAEVEERARGQVAMGLREASAKTDLTRFGNKVSSRLDFREASDAVMRHVYAGVNPAGDVSPYASILLRNQAGKQVQVLGRCRDRFELDGTRVEVFIEEFAVGSFELLAKKPLELRFDIPAPVRQRDYVCVRFSSDDWVYAGRRRRECVTFILDELSIEVGS